MKTNTQHTPGPWEVSNTGSGTIRIGVNFKNPIDTTVICSLSGNGNDPEIKANAQLIANAPELLKENEQLKESLRATQDTYRKTYQDYGAMLENFGTLKALNAELLEALKELISPAETLVFTFNGTVAKEDVKHSIDKAKQAIAKAESKTLSVS